MNIVILERASVGEDVSVDVLNKFGDVTAYNTSPVEMIPERIREADIVIANKSPLNESTLADAVNVKLICEFATGYDNVDLQYCKNRGIKVCNVKGYSTEAVVQHTFALFLYVFEKLNYYDNYVKSGAFASQKNFCNYDMHFGELSGRTWGIVGMGAIGSRVADVATAFGCNVIRYSVRGNVDSNNKYPSVSFDELLAKSDVISVHCPLTDETRELFNYDAFTKMKKDAILINVARGGVVNDADLRRALDEELIYGAGLDVTNTEPMEDSNPLSDYKDSSRLIITPHMAWASNEARRRVVEETALNIEAFINGENRNVVN